MFQYETNENVVERLRFERQPENITLLELNVAQAQSLDLSFRLSNRNVGHINASDQGVRAVSGKGNSLCADSAARFQNAASRGIKSVVMKQLNQCGRLILETDVFPRVVTVNVIVIHA